MVRKTNSSKPNERILDELVASCNDMHSTLHHGSTFPIHHDQSGPLRWRESCDKTIAVARDRLQFRLILDVEQTAGESGVVRAWVNRRLPANLTFDYMQSIFIDGQPAIPTNHSLNRTLALDFQHIAAGSIVVITYQVRVNFNAETTKVIVGDTNVAWSWVSRSGRRVVEPSHSRAKRVPAPHRGVGAAASVAMTAAAPVAVMS